MKHKLDKCLLEIRQSRDSNSRCVLSSTYNPHNSKSSNRVCKNWIREWTYQG